MVPMQKGRKFTKKFPLDLKKNVNDTLSKGLVEIDYSSKNYPRSKKVGNKKIDNINRMCSQNHKKLGLLRELTTWRWCSQALH
jgi:hypothetical protein